MYTEQQERIEGIVNKAWGVIQSVPLLQPQNRTAVQGFALFLPFLKLYPVNKQKDVIEVLGEIVKRHLYKKAESLVIKSPDESDDVLENHCISLGRKFLKVVQYENAATFFISNSARDELITTLEEKRVYQLTKDPAPRGSHVAAIKSPKKKIPARPRVDENDESWKNALKNTNEIRLITMVAWFMPEDKRYMLFNAEITIAGNNGELGELLTMGSYFTKSQHRERGLFGTSSIFSAQLDSVNPDLLLLVKRLMEGRNTATQLDNPRSRNIPMDSEKMAATDLPDGNALRAFQEKLFTEMAKKIRSGELERAWNDRF